MKNVSIYYLKVIYKFNLYLTLTFNNIGQTYKTEVTKHLKKQKHIYTYMFTKIKYQNQQARSQVHYHFQSSH